MLDDDNVLLAYFGHGGQRKPANHAGDNIVHKCMCKHCVWCTLCSLTLIDISKKCYQ